MPTKSIRVLGVVPARGGSKGVPRKNVRLLNGKHLIGYSIESALQSKRLSKVVVSTDDDEIASVAETYGVSVLRRPGELAEDLTPMVPVIQHVLREAEASNKVKYDFIMLLQPTAPMRDADDIDDAIRLAIERNCDSVLSLYQVEDCHPARMYTIESGRLCKVMREPKGSLRQELPPVYHRNGCIYLTSRELLMQEGKLVGETCYPYIMPIERSLNIDTEQDLEFAEFVFCKQARNVE